MTSRLLDLTTFYNRRHWAASYTFETLALDNRSNAFADRPEPPRGCGGSAQKVLLGRSLLAGALRAA